MKLILSSFTTLISAQWVHRGLHEIPQEFLNFPIPQDGLNVTGNVFNWLEEQTSKQQQKHTRGPSFGGHANFNNGTAFTELVQFG